MQQLKSLESDPDISLATPLITLDDTPSHPHPQSWTRIDNPVKLLSTDQFAVFNFINTYIIEK